jgi:hypothetical protein
MSKITVKMMSDTAVEHLKKNIKYITKLITENDDNDWIYQEFPKPIFVEKKYEIDDFSLIPNPKSANKEIDFKNSVTIYENLRNLPRYILIDQRFWLWLHFEKFYSIVKDMMTINGISTIQNMWMHTQGVRRGLMFGVLSRCYFRVSLSVDLSLSDKYELTKWIIDNPLRFRELTWRTYSSEEHIVRGVLKGQRKAVAEINDENNSIYAEIAKYISRIGSVQLLDIISEDEISELVYEKSVELLRDSK